ncbi:MAG: hypothetical protein JWR90_3241 [Marmoricola sp.]|jgi:hypothetical protein|nr:hypothetical protein [Marmoricola sp.]
MSNVHGSAVPAAAAYRAPWELLGFPRSLLSAVLLVNAATVTHPVAVSCGDRRRNANAV